MRSRMLSRLSLTSANLSVELTLSICLIRFSKNSISLAGLNTTKS